MGVADVQLQLTVLCFGAASRRTGIIDVTGVFVFEVGPWGISCTFLGLYNHAHRHRLEKVVL
jgi:hypothetical protein